MGRGLGASGEFGREFQEGRSRSLLRSLRQFGFSAVAFGFRCTGALNGFTSFSGFRV